MPRQPRVGQLARGLDYTQALEGWKEEISWQSNTTFHPPNLFISRFEPRVYHQTTPRMILSCGCDGAPWIGNPRAFLSTTLLCDCHLASMLTSKSM